MRTPLERIRLGATFLMLVAVVSVVGYRYLAQDQLDQQPWIESMHWFVITVSSVGYGEDSKSSPILQFFTIGVIVVGMSTALYVIGGFLQMLTEGEIERALGVRRMSREIKRLSDHIIVCGYGRIGQILTADLAKGGEPLVVADNNTETIAAAQAAGHLALAGDATQESVLIEAGIERAKCMVCALPSDADNMYIALSSRNLNANLRIISRGEDPSAEKKLIQAGANQVVLTAAIGAQRLAQIVTRPHTADLIDRVTDRSILDVDLDELRVLPTSPLCGKTVRDAEANRKHRLLVVTIAQAAGDVIFNPDDHHVFQANDTVVVMGRPDDVERFRSLYQI